MFSFIRFRLNKKNREVLLAKKRLQKMNTYDPKFVEDLNAYRDILQVIITAVDKRNIIDPLEAEQRMGDFLGFADKDENDKTRKRISTALNLTAENRAITLRACEATLKENKPTQFAFTMYLEMYKLEAKRKKEKPKIRVRIVDNQLQEVKRGKTNWVIILRWIGILPIAVAAFILGEKVAGLITLAFDRLISIVANPYYFRLIIAPMFIGSASGYWFMLAGVFIAPKFREKVNSVLLIIAIVVMSMGLIGAIMRYVSWSKPNYMIGDMIEIVFVIIGSSMAYFSNKLNYA
jgi:hypothetical protein